MICRCFQYCISMQSLLGECKTSTLPPELQYLVASLEKGHCAWAPSVQLPAWFCCPTNGVCLSGVQVNNTQS